MLIVVSGLIGRAQGLYQLLAVVREFIDGVSLIVHHPNVFLRIVRIDGDVVRAAQHLVPLRPVLDDLSRRIDHHDAMLPARIDAELSTPHRISRCSHRTDGSIAPRYLRDGKRDARTDGRIGNLLGPLEVGYFAPLENEHAIGAFGEDAFHGSIGPFFVPR